MLDQIAYEEDMYEMVAQLGLGNLLEIYDKHDPCVYTDAEGVVRMFAVGANLKDVGKLYRVSELVGFAKRYTKMPDLHTIGECCDWAWQDQDGEWNIGKGERPIEREATYLSRITHSRKVIHYYDTKDSINLGVIGGVIGDWRDSLYNLNKQETEDEDMKEQDIVKNPKHYQITDELQVKDVLAIVLKKIENSDFRMGLNAAGWWQQSMQYALRFYAKNGIQDLEKCVETMMFCIQSLKEDNGDE